MVAEQKTLGMYLDLIKKVTAWKVKDPEHQQFKEDIVQEAFLKLFKQGFFDKNDIEDPSNEKNITSYLNNTVRSCYQDFLTSQGINRRLTKAEKEASGFKTQNIKNASLDDVIETDEFIDANISLDEQVYAKQAFKWIEECFETISSGIESNERKKFFHAAFWDFDCYNLPMKALAGHLGYTSSNPTQELKRFVEKVSLCTQPHGVKVVTPHEQIQFLREQLQLSGVSQ